MSDDPNQPVYIFRVRIVYKSGHTEEMDCTEFSYKNGFGGSIEYSWKFFGDPRPIHLGANDIAAVWQVSRRFPTAAELEQIQSSL